MSYKIEMRAHWNRGRNQLPELPSRCEAPGPARGRSCGWLALAAILFALDPSGAWAQSYFTVDFSEVLSVTARARGDSQVGNLILNEASGTGTATVVGSSAASGDGMPVVGSKLNVLNIVLWGSGDLFRDVARQCEAQALLAMRSPQFWRLRFRFDIGPGGSVVHQEAAAWLHVNVAGEAYVRCILIRKATSGTAAVTAPAGDPATEFLPEPPPSAVGSAEQPDGGDE